MLLRTLPTTASPHWEHILTSPLTQSCIFLPPLAASCRPPGSHLRAFARDAPSCGNAPPPSQHCLAHSHTSCRVPLGRHLLRRPVGPLCAKSPFPLSASSSHHTEHQGLFSLLTCLFSSCLSPSTPTSPEQSFHQSRDARCPPAVPQIVTK